jgi:hypothetical protein
MTTVQRVFISIEVVLFVFGFLAALMPHPDKARGDSKLGWALMAAISAGAIVAIA